VPAGGDAGEYQPIGSGKNRAGQQPGADGQGVVLIRQVDPQIHGAEKIADTVALHAIKAGGGIQHQYFKFVFVFRHFEPLINAPCLFATTFSPATGFTLLFVMKVRWLHLFSSVKISVEHVFLHHPLGVEKGAVDGDGVGHHVHEKVPIVIKKGNNGMLQLFVQRWGIL
jgi:hypothetical protein